MPLSMIVGIEPAMLTEVLLDGPILRSPNESPAQSLLARAESINSHRLTRRHGRVRQTHSALILPKKWLQLPPTCVDEPVTYLRVRTVDRHATLRGAMPCRRAQVRSASLPARIGAPWFVRVPPCPLWWGTDDAHAVPTTS